MSTPSAAQAGRIRAWADDLRGGSVRTWAEFLASDPTAGTATAVLPGAAELAVLPGSSQLAVLPGSSQLAVLPGSSQLELLRRLNLLGAVPAGLADLVLTSTSPGRGLVDSALPDPAGPVPHGSPALPPDELPLDELVRAACGVLIRLLPPLAEQTPDLPRAPRRPLRRWLTRRRVWLLGSQAAIEAVRGALLAAGVGEGPRRATYLVLGGPVESMMAEHWAFRVRVGAGTRWPRLWRAAARNDGLPIRIDLARIAEAAVRRHGADRVHVLIGADTAELAVQAARVLGLTEPIAAPRADPAADPVAVELLRRLNPLLVLAAGQATRDRIAERLWPYLLVTLPPRAAQPLAAPPGSIRWGRTAARRLREQLSAGDYAVHGDLALLERESGSRRMVASTDVLALALELIRATWTEGGN